MSNNIKRINCVKSGCGTFPMDVALYNRLRKTGETWTCPAGHEQHFTESKEKQLKDQLEDALRRVERLEGKLEAAEEQAESYKDTVYDYLEDLQDESDRRRHLEGMILANRNGIVEVGPSEFKWSCPCGSHGRKAFDSPDEAREAMGKHHDRVACVGAVGLGRVMIP